MGICLVSTAWETFIYGFYILPFVEYQVVTEMSCLFESLGGSNNDLKNVSFDLDFLSNSSEMMCAQVTKYVPSNQKPEHTDVPLTSKCSKYSLPAIGAAKERAAVRA